MIKLHTMIYVSMILLAFGIGFLVPHIYGRENFCDEITLKIGKHAWVINGKVYEYRIGIGNVTEDGIMQLFPDGNFGNMTYYFNLY